MKLQRVIQSHVRSASTLARFALVALLACAGAATLTAATHTAATANRSDVAAAYALTANGDTLAIPAGTGTGWTTTLEIAKNIIVKGAGRDSTILNSTIPGTTLPILRITSVGVRVTGITFQETWTAGGGVGITVAADNVRINHCRFKQFDNRGIWNFGKNTLIDHNIFEDCWSSVGSYADQYTAWTRPLGLGTTNSVVGEDNYMHISGSFFTPVGVDHGQGARGTWRFNVLSNQGLSNFDYFLDAHGNQGSPFGSGSSVAGTVFVETYNNFISVFRGLRGNFLRGGTQIHYNNTYKAQGGNWVSFGNTFFLTEEDGYRSGNPICSNWPAFHQITNSYFFANTFNGASVTGVNLDNPGTTPCTNPLGCGADWPSDGIFIQSGRDYWFQEPLTNFYRPLQYPHPRILIDNDPPIPAAFTLTTPSNGATGVSVTPQMSWTASSGHTEYRLIISRSPFMTSPVWDTTLSPGSLNYTVPGGILLNNTRYYWLMRATGANGVNTSTSAPFVFTVGGGTLVPGSVQLSTNAISVNEDAGTVELTLHRVGGSDGQMGVSYATADGTAIDGLNYTAQNGTADWANGNADALPVFIPILNDGVYGPDLQFTFTISNQTGGGSLGSPTTCTITVVNVNPPPFQIPVVSYPTFHAYEALISQPMTTNTAGEAFQPVEVTDPNGRGRLAFRVPIPSTNLYRIKATVRAPTIANNSFFIDWNNDPPADPEATWSIDPLTAATGLETRYVSWLGNGTVANQFPTNTWALDQGTNTLYIVGREANTFIDEITVETVPVPGTIALSSAVYAGDEDSGTVTITARRTGGSDGAVGVSYATANGTAVSGVNYTGTTGTLSWADAEAGDKTFTITLIDDGVFGPDLTFTVALSSPTGGAALGTPNSATVSVLNVNPPPMPDPGIIQFAVSAQSVNEDAGTVTIAIRRTDGSDGAVGVSYATQNISATAGVDYTAVSSTASWLAADATDKTFPVTILDNGVFTTNRTFRVILSSPTGGATLGTPTTNVVTIINTNPEVPPPAPQMVAWELKGYPVNEDAGTVETIVVRQGGTNGVVTVDYTTGNGTAIAGRDYVATSGTLTFPDGASSATFDVTIIDNNTALGNRFFYLTLSNPVGATINSPATVVAEIIDNDGPVQSQRVLRSAKLRNAVIGERP